MNTVQENLRKWLRQFGEANDAADRGYLAAAERMRAESVREIEKLLLQFPETGKAYPGLTESIRSGRIFLFEWARFLEAMGNAPAD